MCIIIQIMHIINPSLFSTELYYSIPSQTEQVFCIFFCNSSRHLKRMGEFLLIYVKVVNFSTFINIVQYSKTAVSHALCDLYELLDANGLPNVKLLIGSLHWMRKIRNACAHNERVYCLSRLSKKGSSGRIVENFLSLLGRGYTRNQSQNLFDLFVYFKYYLPKNEYKQFITELKTMLNNLSTKIHPHAFDYVRGQMGIRNMSDLDMLCSLPKNDIDYNKFDK